MDNRICSITNISQWLLSSAILLLFMGCSRGSSTQKEVSGELTVDETLLPEQQLELYKLQTNAFADSIFREGYSILVRDVDSLFFVYYAKRDTIYQAYYDNIVNRPPIMFKDIRTGRVQEVSIPASIDGKPININTIVEYRGLEDKVIMSITGKSPKELREKLYESFDVLCLDAKDNTFHYIVGDCPWCVGNKFVYDFRRDWIKIPLSQILNGSYSLKAIQSEIESQDTVDDSFSID